MICSDVTVYTIERCIMCCANAMVWYSRWYAILKWSWCVILSDCLITFQTRDLIWLYMILRLCKITIVNLMHSYITALNGDIIIIIINIDLNWLVFISCRCNKCIYKLKWWHLQRTQHCITCIHKVLQLFLFLRNFKQL